MAQKFYWLIRDAEQDEEWAVVLAESYEEAVSLAADHFGVSSDPDDDERQEFLAGVSVTALNWDQVEELNLPFPTTAE